jgi:hypothetical protein
MSVELSNVLRTVGGEAAFLFFDSPAVTSSDNPDDAWTAELEVRAAGERHSLRLMVTHSVANELTANMLGLEPDSDEANEAEGAGVGEFLNILAGAWAVAHFGPEVRCDIGLPRIVRGPAQPPEGEHTTEWVDGVEPLTLSRAAA